MLSPPVVDQHLGIKHESSPFLFFPLQYVSPANTVSEGEDSPFHAERSDCSHTFPRHSSFGHWTFCDSSPAFLSSRSFQTNCLVTMVPKHGSRLTWPSSQMCLTCRQLARDGVPAQYPRAPALLGVTPACSQMCPRCLSYCLAQSKDCLFAKQTTANVLET